MSKVLTRISKMMGLITFMICFSSFSFAAKDLGEGVKLVNDKEFDDAISQKDPFLQDFQMAIRMPTARGKFLTRTYYVGAVEIQKTVEEWADADALPEQLRSWFTPRQSKEVSRPSLGQILLAYNLKLMDQTLLKYRKSEIVEGGEEIQQLGHADYWLLEKAPDYEDAEGEYPEEDERPVEGFSKKRGKTRVHGKRSRKKVMILGEALKVETKPNLKGIQYLYKTGPLKNGPGFTQTEIVLKIHLSKYDYETRRQSGVVALGL
jgi:hypothetical protein